MTDIRELGDTLQILLSKLMQNRNFISRDLLKTYYQKPYEELILQINQTATAFVKAIVARDLLLNPDVSLEEQIEIINYTIQKSGMIQKISHCMSTTYDVRQIQQLAFDLREEIKKELAPYIAKKNCLVIDLFHSENPPILYNTLTKQVFKNKVWIKHDLDLHGKLLIYNPTKICKSL